MNESLNELLNDEAVCRTAPAKPGLLIIRILLAAFGVFKLNCFTESFFIVTTRINGNVCAILR